MSKELCNWLRDNSSGAYRQSSEAADLIEAQAKEISEVMSANIRMGNRHCADLEKISDLQQQLAEESQHTTYNALLVMDKDKEIEYHKAYAEEAQDSFNIVMEEKKELLIEIKDLRAEIESHAPHGRNFTNNQVIEMRGKLITANDELRAALVVAVDALDNAIKLFDSEILNEYDGTDMLDDRLADIDAERQALTRCKEVFNVDK